VSSIAAVRAAVGELAGDDPARDASTLGAELVELRRLAEALEAQWLRRLRAFDTSGGAEAFGAVSTAGWLRAACRLAPGVARERVRLARRLPDLPATAAAFAAGEITGEHARLVATAVDELADALGPKSLPASDPVSADDAGAVEPEPLTGPEAAEVVLVAAERALVEVARRTDPLRLRREIVHARHALAPDVVAAEAERAFERRWLSVSATFDGMVAVDGVLDAEGGAVLLAAVMPLAQPAGPDDIRTAGQRRADALVDLARRQLDAGGLPALGGERPHLTVVADLATLEARAGARAAETGWRGPLCGEAARRLACDAAVARVITGPDSQPLDVGRRTRTIPPAIRTALHVRDGGCRFPGCDRPAPWTDAHHLHHWVDGGPTSLDNLVLLCRTHHRAVHETGWQLTPGPDGTWTATAPKPKIRGPDALAA
jgi:Domain of unknown function (DUF222)/HNH endonuclease